MEAFFKLIGEWLKGRLNRQFYVFLVCLFVSAFIWLLIALSKTYTTFVEFPVHYQNLPEDRVVMNDLPDVFRLEVRSHGFSLLSYRWFWSDKDLDIDIRQLKGKEARKKVMLPTRELVDDLSQQFNDQTQVTKIHPDTLLVKYAERIVREVPIVPKIDIEFAEQFGQAGKVRVHPANAQVSGPEPVVDTLEKVRTEPIVRRGVDHTIDREVPVEALPKCRIEPERVKVTLPVDEFTEGRMVIPVRLKNIPPDRAINTYPDSVKVNYLVALSNYNKVEQDMFRAVVNIPDDPNKLKEMTRLRVKLVSVPGFVRNIRYEPEKVEFLIRK